VRHKARDALFGLTECGVHSNGLNPITVAKLYTIIVLPRAFLAGELWNTITVCDMPHLKTTHHFWLKRIQNLPGSTRSDMVKGMVGFTSIYPDMYRHAQTCILRIPVSVANVLFIDCTNTVTQQLV